VWGHGEPTREEDRVWCGKERMKTLFRNDMQMNILSRREPNVASRTPVGIVLEEFPTTMPNTSIMTVFLAK